MPHAVPTPPSHNPVLIEVTRGPLVECRHRGVVAVADAFGSIVLELGEVHAPVFPRSAIKPLQALAVLETGAAHRYGFQDRHIALAAASHSGTRAHVEAAAEMLASAGLSETALHCGTHLPRDEEEQRVLLRANAKPGPLHHNCSGKHAAMLATAKHMGEPIESYERSSNPVQIRIRFVFGTITMRLKQIELPPPLAPQAPQAPA